MKWQWHKIAMAVVIGSMLVTGCGNGSGSQNSSDSKQEGADSTSSQPTAEKSAPKKKTFTSLDGTMQLTLPSTWRQDDEINNIVPFAAYHRSQSRLAVASKVPKADLEDAATLDDIIEWIITNFDDVKIDEMEVIEIRDATVGPDAAKQLEFRGLAKNGTKKKNRYLVTALEKGDYFYQITFWTEDIKFDKYKEEFEQATQTFKVLKASDSEAAATAPAKPKVFKSADSRMELTLTANWLAYPLNEDAEISAFYPAGNEFVIVVSDAREEMGDIQTLEDYYDLLYERSYSELAPEGSVEPKSVAINGLPALQFEIQWVSEDKTKIAMLITLIESPEQFTQVVFWTIQSKIEQKRERFIEAAASYKEHAQ
ncbi:PsbP-related protein [Paenibacillus dendritiformis]|uniref:Tfp pilus assembly protein, major pilin PilA n=1 Tax=Paenibacillus dendritiformis C454 TaxID=1131935 RepID=H3SGR4_9BACL|nr:PsbP-related protein [Paenibacillus dendritiformis]EHQ61711.1 Tfp pilus assembly protein, major pilin PilA [Paenibacillus dendritiformis C454]CAH8767969.1 DUF1795 domain-containing protein [Paenibacillus dendritiformis]